MTCHTAACFCVCAALNARLFACKRLVAQVRGESLSCGEVTGKETDVRNKRQRGKGEGRGEKK